MSGICCKRLTVRQKLKGSEHLVLGKWTLNSSGAAFEGAPHTHRNKLSQEHQRALKGVYLPRVVSDDIHQGQNGVWDLPLPRKPSCDSQHYASAQLLNPHRI